jgi:general secretion pathway protein D
MKVSIMTAAILWCLSSVLAIADDSQLKQASVTAGANAAGTDLRTLMKELGARMHRHFILDPRTPPTIDLGGLKPDEVTYPELLSILEANFMMAFADGGLTLVLPITEASKMPIPVVMPDNIKTSDGELITCIVPVKNISAAQLVPTLRPMVPAWGYLGALRDRNALIITDRTGNVKHLIELVKVLDGLPKSAEFAPGRGS